jgi:hypothetical protein
MRSCTTAFGVCPSGNGPVAERHAPYSGAVAAQLKSARRLPAWVLGLRSELHRANVALAADVADAVMSLGDADVTRRSTKAALRDNRASGPVGPGLPVSVVAKVFDVTDRTARSWIECGTLKAVKGSRPLAVTTRSLGEALAAATRIRQVGQDERLLRGFLDVLDDQRTRYELADRIGEPGSRVPIDPNRIPERVSPGRA